MQKRLVAVIAALAMLAGACSTAADTRPPTTSFDMSSVQAGFDSITAPELQTLIERLASPQMKGRRADTPESAAVAAMLSHALAANGFSPVDRDYLQEFCLFRDVTTTDYDRRVWDYFQTHNWTVPECGANVVGILPGAVNPLEFVVLVAHRDHLGVNPSRVAADNAASPTGRVLNPGADDNASGTAALVEIAEAFGALRDAGIRPARSIIVLFADAEEYGLWGSRFFAEWPPVPLDAIRAVVNLDMIGRNATDYLEVIGSPGIADFVERNPDLARMTLPLAEKLGFTVHYPKDEGANRDLFLRSDQYSFYEASPSNDRIPVVFLSGGLHEDYHRPTDTPDKINSEKVRNIAQLAFLLLWQISEADTPPDYIE